MIPQYKVDALCQDLEALFIPDGPLETVHGARSYVRRFLLKLLRETHPVENALALACSLASDCRIQAMNERQSPEIRAKYVAETHAWNEFQPMLQALWYKTR